MKELQAIVTNYETLRQHGEAAALATVVRVSGSAYRRPGARMLVTSSGRCVGSVSGGCLETDVIRKARQVIQTGESRLITYDTTDDEELEFGLGCQSVIDILIERLTPGQDSALTLPGRLLGQRQAGVLATVYRTEDSNKALLGDRFLLRADGALFESSPAKPWRAEALEESHTALSQKKSDWKTEVFLEYLAPPIALVIFGAGHDAPPLVRIAAEMGWQTTVIDHRPGYAAASRFPTVNRLLSSPPESLPGQLVLDDRTAVILMTHNYHYDKSVLEIMLAAPPPYLGILGPRRRTERLLCELGLNKSPEFLHSPTGLDIGGETPEQIALSIAAEIQAALAGRSGGMLRNRPGPIYSGTVL